MMNIYSKSFAPPSVRREVADIIIGNVVQGFQSVLHASHELAMPISDFQEDQTLLLSLPESTTTLTPEIILAVQHLLGNPQFLALYDRRNLFQVQDCWRAFADSCAAQKDGWGGPDWVPTEDECIRARVRTSGIIEEDFKHKGVHFKLFDAGGQRAWVFFVVFYLLTLTI
jgi:hypothetical protein